MLATISMRLPISIAGQAYISLRGPYRAVISDKPVGTHAVLSFKRMHNSLRLEATVSRLHHYSLHVAPQHGKSILVQPSTVEVDAIARRCGQGDMF